MTHGDLSRAIRAAAAHVFDVSRVALFGDAAIGAVEGWRKRDAAAVALLKALAKRVRREGARLLGVSVGRAASIVDHGAARLDRCTADRHRRCGCVGVEQWRR